MAERPRDALVSID